MVVTDSIPGRFPGDAVFWTYFAVVALIAGGIGLFIPHTARLAALLSGGMVFSWFWVVHIPLTFQSVSSGIALFEALAVASIAFVHAGFLRGQKIKRQRVLKGNSLTLLHSVRSNINLSLRGMRRASVRRLLWKRFTTLRRIQ